MPTDTTVHNWRHTHLGRLTELARQRFDARVLTLMAHNDELALALSHLAARGQLGASHIQITRHLPVGGCRLTVLADHAGITKQAMGKLVDQCEAWGLVARSADARDARAIQVAFTDTGRQWLAAYRQAVVQAEAEFRSAVGDEVATVVLLGLEAYVG
ncbi:MAG: winged helix-turn-helix transcriptional regulator [Rhodoferax sp.]|nr:winged helix-turn-helix transcriptional regulator [Rhodoferax sp.]HRA62025.1 MarR family winged helix-turn-helix transcriptional regulator [Burkholderiaceae bacterium]